MKKTLFRNAKIITATGVTQGEVLVEDKKIKKIDFHEAIHEAADEVIDVNFNYLSPGFIDVHTHGAGNCDFMDGDLQSIYTACKTHMNYGVTSIVPTSLACSKESLLDFIDLFNQVDLKKEGCPNILGLHLEGPYFSHAQSGAQDPHLLRNPDKEEYEEILRRTTRIVRWSFAVELNGANEFFKTLQAHHISPSLAHSNATCKQVMDAYENGLEAMTHFYSAMTNVGRINTYRVAGAVEAGYLLDDLFVEVIADGKHLPKELLQLIYKVKSSDKICLVSDSMRGSGMPDGAYILGNKDLGFSVIVEEGVAKMPDRSSFAGSVATADRLVRTFKELTQAPLFEVVKMMTLNPAKLLKIENQKGSIAVGKDADLIIFDENINVSTVMVMGHITCKK